MFMNDNLQECHVWSKSGERSAIGTLVLLVDTAQILSLIFFETNAIIAEIK